MKKSDLKEVLNFCKKSSISDQPLNKLADMFETKHTLARHIFELCMLHLNKKPALKAQSLCQQYHKNEGEFGYEKFCKEQMPVSEIFWMTAVKDIKTLENPIKLPETNDLIETPIESLQEKPENGFHELLPVKWSTMNKNERIEFAKKIQHEGFRNYVLELDPNVKRYFSLLRKKDSSIKMKLYVTLFQVPASCSEESKNLLKCFVENLNSFGRANLQFVECKEPNVIEIREMR